MIRVNFVPTDTRKPLGEHSFGQPSSASNSGLSSQSELKNSNAQSPVKDRSDSATASESEKTAISANPVPAASKRLKYEMCKNWREKGECKYGARCLFAHGEDELTKRGSTGGALNQDESKAAKAEEKNVEPSKDLKGSAEEEIKVVAFPPQKIEDIDAKTEQIFKTPDKEPIDVKQQDIKSMTGNKTDKCLDQAFAALADHANAGIDNERGESEDQFMIINGEYNDLLDRDMPKVSFDKAGTKKTTSPYSGKGNSTHPSSTNKSPLEAYTDSYDYRMGGVTPSKVTSGSSQRSSFDDSMIQSDHFCAKDRCSMADIMMNEEKSPSKIIIGQGLLEVRK